MDTFRIARLQEMDFDAIFATAGGRRIDAVGPGSRGSKSADYALGHSIVELKFVIEEGLEKSERQKKLANLFGPTQPHRAVVVLSPALLSDEAVGLYYRIMETPIKTHVAKANKQLKESLQSHVDATTSVLLIVNVGYDSLNMHEFEDIARRRVTADTSHIHHVISAGIYFYGDGFDYYGFESFRLFSVDVTKPFPEFSALQDAWKKYVEQMITDMITGKKTDAYDKGVIVDFSFRLGGTTYVKPSPPIGNDSAFYRKGRPRNDTTGIVKSPPVGLVFPHLSQDDWNRATEALQDPVNLQNSYADYLQKESRARDRLDSVLRPFVPFPVAFPEFQKWANGSHQPVDFASLCKYAANRFSDAVRALCESAIDIDISKVVPSQYVLLVVQEIGQDKALDLSSAYLVHEAPSSATKEALFENVNIFFEYGMTLASAYAVMSSVGVVVYKKDARFKWK